MCESDSNPSLLGETATFTLQEVDTDTTLEVGDIAVQLGEDMCMIVDEDQPQLRGVVISPRPIRRMYLL